MILGAVAGLVLSLVSLLPGLHAAAWLPLLLPWFGVDAAVVAAGTFVGSSVALGILKDAFHPVGEGLAAHADVAAQLALAGSGRQVIDVHKFSVAYAGALTLGMGLLVCLASLVGADLLGLGLGMIKPLMPLVLTLVLGAVVYRAKRPGRTLGVMALAGLTGFISFNHPLWVTSDFALTPMLTGLFLMPAGWSLWAEHGRVLVPGDGVLWAEVLPEEGQDMAGAWIGMGTALMAGIGMGSLVSLCRKEGDPWGYLAMASGAEAGCSLMAVLLFLLAGKARTGVSAALGMAGVGGDPLLGLVGVVAMGLGLWVGLRWLEPLTEPYRALMVRMPRRWVGGGLLGLGLASVAWEMGWPGVVMLILAWLVSGLGKSWKTPNQASLACLSVPVLIGHLGLALPLAKGIGLV